MSAASPQAEPARTVLLTRSATQGAAFARALAEESAQNGLGEPRVLFAPLQQARTVEPGADHAHADVFRYQFAFKTFHNGFLLFDNL